MSEPSKEGLEAAHRLWVNMIPHIHLIGLEGKEKAILSLALLLDAFAAKARLSQHLEDFGHNHGCSTCTRLQMRIAELSRQSEQRDREGK